MCDTSLHRHLPQHEMVDASLHRTFPRRSNGCVRLHDTLHRLPAFRVDENVGFWLPQVELAFKEICETQIFTQPGRGMSSGGSKALSLTPIGAGG